MQDARAYAQAREYEAALEIFRQLAQRNPQDFEARVWAARVESWQGNLRLAEQHYQEVLRDDPGNLEAELGLVDVLSWQGHYQEAGRRLGSLQAEHPENVAILLRQGRLARWQGRRGEALRTFKAVLVLEPDNQQAQQAIEALQWETHYQLAAGYFFEEFDFAGNTHGQFVEFLYHDLDRLWLLGRFEFQNKFDENNTRYTLGSTYRFFRSTWVRAQVGLAPPGDSVIANQDYTLEVTQELHPAISVGAAYRFLDFRSADVQLLTGLANWHPRPDLHLYILYSPARTDFESPRTHVWNHNGGGRLVWDAHRKVSPYVSFSVGSESFTGLTADQLGAFAAQTYGAGAEVRFTPLQGFYVGYYYQNRTRGNRQQGFHLSYYHRF